MDQEMNEWLPKRNTFYAHGYLSSCLKTNILWNINNSVNFRKQSHISGSSSLEAVAFLRLHLLFKHQSDLTITFNLPFPIFPDADCSHYYPELTFSNVDLIMIPSLKIPRYVLALLALCAMGSSFTLACSKIAL